MLKMLMKRFIAGNSPEEALRVAKNLLDEGFLVDLNIIGENETVRISRAFEYYKNLIAWMHKEKVFTDISLKLSHFGSKTAGPCQIAHLAKELERVNKRITIDMEDIETDLHIYSALECFIQEKINNIGMTLALNRRNVEIPYFKDNNFTITSCGHDFMIPYSRIYRICKGAKYKKHKDKNFQNELERKDMTAIKCRSFYLYFLKSELYTGFAIARDLELISKITRFVEIFKISKDSFEFQMLYGIRMDIARKLLKQGYRIRIYVPFLFNEPYKKALPYFLRRCSFKVVRALIRERLLVI